MKIADARFERAAVRPEDEPASRGAEVVFLGRSNVGKSSLINGLLGVKGLARTSSTPGRTQTVNFYRVNGKLLFVDLPGYGYARAPQAVRRAWGPMVESYLTRRREAIAVAIVAVDARHAPSPLDRTMLAWLVERGIPALVVGVKSDKLSGNDRAKAGRALAAALPAAEGAVAPFLVSAVTGSGMPVLWRHVDAALEERRNRGRAGRDARDEDAWTSAS